jgi:rubrerythrin
MKQPNALNESAQDLLYQALETELGGVEIYRTALTCVRNPQLRAEWEKYLEQTRRHVDVAQRTCVAVGLDPARDTPGRQVVRHIGKSLVQAMHMALGSDDPKAAEIVAAECVTLAETKDHLNWSLIGRLVEESSPHESLAAAHAEVEDEEDQHYYHGAGWTRELWIASLGMKAELPPPEEERDVRTAHEAADAKESSGS